MRPNPSARARTVRVVDGAGLIGEVEDVLRGHVRLAAVVARPARPLVGAACHSQMCEALSACRFRTEDVYI